MESPKILAVVVIYACWVPYSLGESRSLEMKGKVAAEQRVTQEARWSKPVALRRGDVEQELVELQYLNRSEYPQIKDRIPVACVEIYQVIPVGLHVENDVIDSVGVDLGDTPPRLLAYGCKNGEVFELYGFADPEAGFNRLVTILDLKEIKKSDQALTVFLTYSKLIYPKEGEEMLVEDDLDLMTAVIGYSRKHKGNTTFRSSWRRYSPAIKRQIVAPNVSAVEGGFRITYFTFYEGDIRKNSLMISPDAQISRNKSQTIFRGLGPPSP